MTSPQMVAITDEIREMIVKAQEEKHEHKHKAVVLDKEIMEVLEAAELTRYAENFIEAEAVFADLKYMSDESWAEIIPKKLPRERLRKKFRELFPDYADEAEEQAIEIGKNGQETLIGDISQDTAQREKNQLAMLFGSYWRSWSQRHNAATCTSHHQYSLYSALGH